jgi:hypothetical protein
MYLLASNVQCCHCQDHNRPCYQVIFMFFLFWVSASCYAYFIKVIGRTVPHNNYLRCLFIFILPLHVLALPDHLQAENTILLGRYNGSVVLCYKSYFVYVLANTAVVSLNVTVGYPNLDQITSLLS